MGTRKIAVGDQDIGSMPSFPLDSNHGKMPVGKLTCASNLQSMCTRIEGENGVLECEICGPNSDKTAGWMPSAEQPWKRFSEAIISSNSKKQIPYSVKGKCIDNFCETTSFQNKEITEKFEASLLAKRPCEFSEVRILKKRKITHPNKMSIGLKDDTSLPPVNTYEVAPRSCLQTRERVPRKPIGTSDAVIREGKNEADIVLARPNLLAGAQVSCVNEDTSSREERVEFELCVSLLRKYGVLKDNCVCSSQSSSFCAPHPGCIGDGLQSKLCKICNVPEDAGNTVICDECQETFHLSCCTPRMSSKFFEREDNWYCSSCKKQRKKASANLMEGSSSASGRSTINRNGRTGISGKDPLTPKSYNSKVRLGRAHQAEVPLWTGTIEDEDLECCFADQPGLEEPLSQEDKDAEEDRIWTTFNERVLSLNWLPAKMLPYGTAENWLQCQSIIKGAYRDPDGQEHNEVVCGKWRRCPLDAKQSDSWECFCVIQWDPRHADCAVSQELPSEEILHATKVKSEEQDSKDSKKQSC